jgi:hypothetical protein
MLDRTLTDAPPHDCFRRFGDRTSSLATLGAQFETRRVQGRQGLVRVVTLPAALVAASEPWPSGGPRRNAGGAGARSGL